MPDLTFAGYTPETAFALFARHKIRPDPYTYLEEEREGVCGCLVGALVAEKCGSVEAVFARISADNGLDCASDLLEELYPDEEFTHWLSTGFFPRAQLAGCVSPPAGRGFDGYEFARAVHRLAFPPKSDKR